ncbi:MAG: hypothetical protein IT433_11980 [Phycisphaerales bacterium]|nr:hypothetical protein [Phycisphaerales bacterium]
MYTHVFAWRRERVTIVYSISRTRHGLQLIIDDVSAGTLDVANSVPDWLIEHEAGAAAAAHGAGYL